jgi:hypothetical protein
MQETRPAPDPGDAPLRGKDVKKKAEPAPTFRSLLKKYWWLLAFPTFFFSVMAFALSSGYRTGVEQRKLAEAQAETQKLIEQFDLGMQDLLEGRYDLAKQRAEYILEVDPNFEPAIGLLDLSLQALNQPTLTPTIEVTETTIPATPTPTPDLSSIESHYQAAVDAINREDWTEALNLLIDLRAEYPDYLVEEVNQRMFQALRNRGLKKILSSQLEQGIYDLSLAERFAPLDSQATNWRNSAAFYLFANSFVGLDWTQAYQWFSQLCAAGIWDSCYKYAISAKGYGDLLVATEDPCGAIVVYEQSLLTLGDAQLEPTATEAAILCLTATAPTPTETPTLEGSETVTPTHTQTSSGGGPTATPTRTSTPSPPTATATLAPTATSTSAEGS